MAKNPCSLYQLVHILGKKYSFPVMQLLSIKGQISFSQIEKSSGKISPRALSGALFELEKLHIISKTEGKSSKYSLTQEGKKLACVMNELKEWMGMCNTKVPSKCTLNCMECDNFYI